MGLFGANNKTEASARITDFFSTEDLSKIKELVGPKRAEHKYKFSYMDMVNCLMNAAENTEKTLGKKDVKKILYSTGGMTKMEPSLNPIFKPAIEKMRAFVK